jgi:hypothetical protein
MLVKEKCNCGAKAIYVYMPGYSGGGNPFSCYDCVPKGCSCNDSPMSYPPDGIEGVVWEKSDENPNWWHSLDSNGNQYPCIEYTSDDEGFYTEEFTKWAIRTCKVNGYKIIDDRYPDWTGGIYIDDYLFNKINDDVLHLPEGSEEI